MQHTWDDQGLHTTAHVIGQVAAFAIWESDYHGMGDVAFHAVRVLALSAPHQLLTGMAFSGSTVALLIGASNYIKHLASVAGYCPRVIWRKWS